MGCWGGGTFGRKEVEMRNEWSKLHYAPSMIRVVNQGGCMGRACSTHRTNESRILNKQSVGTSGVKKPDAGRGMVLKRIQDTS
jgi:hypothetical protein